LSPTKPPPPLGRDSRYRPSPLLSLHTYETSLLSAQWSSQKIIEPFSHSTPSPPPPHYPQLPPDPPDSPLTRAPLRACPPVHLFVSLSLARSDYSRYSSVARANPLLQPCRTQSPMRPWCPFLTHARRGPLRYCSSQREGFTGQLPRTRYSRRRNDTIIALAILASLPLCPFCSVVPTRTQSAIPSPPTLIISQALSLHRLGPSQLGPSHPCCHVRGSSAYAVRAPRRSAMCARCVVRCVSPH